MDVGRNHSASVANPSDEVKLSSAMENFDIAVCRTHSNPNPNLRYYSE